MESLRNFNFSHFPENSPSPSLDELIETEPLLKRAYEIAERAHRGQVRTDGSPYITHPKAVMEILCNEWGIFRDMNILIGGALHDSVEDTEIKLEYIQAEFGSDVAELVEGVTQLRSERSDPLSKQIADHETIRKGVRNNFIKPRITILKLADRLHNMRTIGSMPDAKRVAKSWETINIYAKMAESLGMWKVMKELEDTSLKYAEPADFEMFTNLLDKDPRTNSLFVANMKSGLELMLTEVGVGATVNTQVNGLATLRHKMIRERRFNKINDVVSFRIVVDDAKGQDYARNDCYKVLGIARERFGEMEDMSRFDDFFSQVIDNGYSAIQLTLDYPFTTGKSSVEIAITTKTKEEFNSDGVVSLLRRGQKDLSEYVLKLIFTPTGEVKFFKPAATGWDFAYSIEKHMGAQATSVLIDGVRHPISTVLPNAATVEIEAGEPRIAPPPEAVNFVLKPARRIIESQFADLEDAEIISRGKEKVSPVLAEIGVFDLYDLILYKKYSKDVTNMLRSLGCKRYVSNLYRMIGMGQLSVESFGEALKTFNLSKENLNIHSIRIEGTDVKNILGFMGKTIGKYGGNIKPMTNEPGDSLEEETFKATLIVKDLEEKNLKRLQKALLKNPAIKKVDIV